MPFIPHTETETQAMLKTVGVDSLEQLYDEIPNTIPQTDSTVAGEGLDEIEITHLMQEHEPDARTRCFLGAGSYHHHVPAAVWDIVGRGEYYTAYTPVVLAPE